MDDESALVAPPPTLLVPLGPAMSAVAEVLRTRVPAIEVAEPGDLPTPRLDATVWQATSLAVVVLLSEHTDLAEVRESFASLSSQQLPRRTRIWLAADSRCSRSLLAEIDALLDTPAAPRVDSVVILPSARPAAMAIALQAWLWLRHDAPSSAFVDLRDAGGACRFAAVSAVAPASPPPAHATVAGTTGSTGEHALMVLRAELDRRAGEAREAALKRSRRVVEAAGGESALTAAELGAPTPVVPHEDVVAIVNTLGRHDVSGLRAAEQACREIAATSQAADTSESELSEAALAFVQADTAIRLEQQRTGLTAKIGRRKRLAAAVAKRAEVAAVWAGLQAERAAELVRTATAGELEGALAVAVDDEERARQQQQATTVQQAQASWLDDARAAAMGAKPAVQLNPTGFSRAWGRAAPIVRRYVLVPQGFGGEPSAAEPGDVQVRIADGLESPIAVALLMGLPLSGLRLMTDQPEEPSAPAG